MNNKINRLNFSNCELVNHLWPAFLENLGIDRANRAVKQAIDLQKMNGDDLTIPVLFTKTAGIALTTSQLLREQTGLKIFGGNKVVLYSPGSRYMQVLHETKNINNS